MKSYIERTLEFHDLYQKEIVPIFRAYEVYRKNADRRLKAWKYAMLTVCLFCAAFIFDFWAGVFGKKSLVQNLVDSVISNCDNFAFTMIFFFIIFGTIVTLLLWLPTAYYYYAKKQRKGFSLTLKHDCLAKILKIFGDIEWVQEDHQLISNKKLNDSGLFSFFNYRVTDDSFEGTYNGVKFKISEIDLQYRSRKNTIDVFKGVIISFKTNKKIRNRTMISTKGDLTKQNEWILYLLLLIAASFQTICTDSPLLIKIIAIIFFTLAYLTLIKNSKEKTEKFDELKLEDSKFSKKFRAFSSDQVEGRYLLTTAFIERFQNLNTAFGAKRAKCSFFQNNIMIAIQTNKNLFELGSLDKTLEDPESINNFYNELSSIIKMIEYFKLDEKTGL